MKNLVLLFTMLFSVAVFAETGKIGIGDEATLMNVKMTDVSGDRISMADAKKENGLLVMFSCNTCPFVIRWEDRFNGLKEWADKHDVGMIVLNSNYQKRDGDDSFENMKKKASDKGYKFNYVVDEDSKIANAFGGQTTPHVFLFDGDMELVYKGAIDDSYKSADEVKKAYVKDAIASIASGDEVKLAETKPVGCSIKRKVE